MINLFLICIFYKCILKVGKHYCHEVFGNKNMILIGVGYKCIVKVSKQYCHATSLKTKNMILIGIYYKMHYKK